MPLTIIPVTNVVGATVNGADLSQLSDADLNSIKNAWNKHGVLFFRDQDLTPEQHLAFAKRLAPVDVNRFFQSVEGHPEVAQVLKEADQIVNIGGAWHTDHSYDQVPARGSILLAREVPPEGGNTLFMSVGAAYDALSDGLKETLEQLSAHHSNEHVFGDKAGYNKATEGRLGNPEGVGSAIHPVVIRHPETGQKLLYVNAAFTTHFVGWTPEESKPLLDFLYTHMINPDFAMEFEWEAGSVAMWDNRSTWHNAKNDYHGHRRLMHRITIQGSPLSGV